MPASLSPTIRCVAARQSRIDREDLRRAFRKRQRVVDIDAR
ncbi:hypothetical protein [Sandaracinobacteroides hominis]|nr:hypothetical protein [Sandaracinobacteroides hominis]